jgi:hypothetical protein
VGRSVEVTPEGVRDHRTVFREFILNIILLKLQLGDANKLGEIVNEYVKAEGYTAKTWADRIVELEHTQENIGSFFKELLSEMLAKQAEIHREFKMLLKAMASAGGHFDALGNRVTSVLGEAAAEAMDKGTPIGETFFRRPDFQKLRPTIESSPQLKEMLGL